MNSSDWNKQSWRNFPARQQPKWPDADLFEKTITMISRLPALVFAGETRALERQLAAAVEGKAFVLQCGDCSEDFSRCHGPDIHNILKVILQMSIILAYAGEKWIVRIGRIAGQYAKPRSADNETVAGQEIPIYRGDMVNSTEPTVEARTPDPRRMLEGYFRAAATINLVRAFTNGGYAALDQVHAWHQDFCEAFPASKKYEELVKGIRKAVRFITAIGIDTQVSQLKQVDLYTSHEALLLGYEEAMTRVDTTTGVWYDTSAHMLWVGDRTREHDGAHVEFLRGVGNPIGMKIGPHYSVDSIKKTIQKINPKNKPGRLTLITRFGAERISSLLPQLIMEIKKEGFRVVWCCDPMHGNTYRNEFLQKTRRFEDIIQEIRAFFRIHEEEGTIAGGVHLELTGDNVTECTGGSGQLLDKHLHRNYQTNCDPRLNAEQAVEVAFELAGILNPQKCGQ